MAGDTIHGQCLCGAVTIALGNPKQSVELCHCDMCRRATGAVYVAVTGESFELGGEECIATYQSSDWAERAFCKTCGSSLWYRFKPTGSRSFLAGLFADADQYPIEKEIFTDEKTHWCTTSGNHPRQTGEEVIAEAKAAGFSFD